MKTKKIIVYGFLVILIMFGSCSKIASGKKLTGPTNSFEFTVINNGGPTGYSVSAGTAMKGDITIPAYYRPNENSDYLPVTEIGERAFEGERDITSIIIPSTVTHIGWLAFADCTRITSITIPKTVTSASGVLFRGWMPSQTINVPFANEESKYEGWRNWSDYSKAIIKYGGK